MRYICPLRYICPDACVVHASGTKKLQANPTVPDPRLSNCNYDGKLMVTMVTMMESIDLVVGEDCLLGSRCQGYNWQMGKWQDDLWQLT